MTQRPRPMSLPSSVWREDFTGMDPVARRVARFTLGMMAAVVPLLDVLRHRHYLGLVWSLTACLLEPARLDEMRRAWLRPEHGTGKPFDPVRMACRHRLHRNKRDPRNLLAGMPGVRMRQDLLQLYRAVPPHVLERLAADDGAAPTHRCIALLADCVGLDEVEVLLLEFAEKRRAYPEFNAFVRELPTISTPEHLSVMAAGLGTTHREVKLRYMSGRPLNALRLVITYIPHESFEDLGDRERLFDDILDQEPEDSTALLEMLVEAAPASALRLSDFGHVGAASSRLVQALAQAGARQVGNLSILIQGEAGSGKSALATVAVRAAGLQPFLVLSCDENGKPLIKEDRVARYLLVQYLVRNRRDVVLILDDSEDVFEAAHESDTLVDKLLSPRSVTKMQSWMRWVIEHAEVPSIWITTRCDGIQAQLLSRFLISVVVPKLPYSVRREMVERTLGGTGLGASLCEEMARDEALSPATLTATRRLWALLGSEASTRTVSEGAAALRRLLHGSAGPRLRRPATEFDAAYLNLAGGVSPLRLCEALSRGLSASLCFFGPPGTGKTEFAHVLADALDRELVCKASSDLISPYVGETERNIARLFNEIDPERTVLLLDEVDSLLRNRRDAERGWEVSQVNELLQQMERFDGILIATTNLVQGLDEAAMRRFSFKLEFKPLTRAQRLSLFAREALGDASQVGAIEPALAKRLDTLEMLTPGDFANVVRQRELLGEPLTPDAFLRRLMAECQYKLMHRALA